MIRRTLMAAGVAALIAIPATAAEPARSRDEARPERKLDLRGLFDRAPGIAAVTAERNLGVTVEATGVEVILARVGPDGELIRVCVDNELAARRFLDAPVDTLRTKQAKEQ